MITVRNLTKKYSPEQEVLSRLSFQIDEGDFIAVLGGSGSGKTTLLRCLSLREKWDEGQFIYDGKDITSASLTEKLRLRKEWAFLEEKPELNLRATALKNVLAGRFFQMPVWRALTGKAGTDDHVMGMDYLEKVGLIGKAHEKAEKLSGGEKQRVAFARALVQGAKMILADEPVSGLDPENGHSVMRDLKALNEKEKVTIVCTLHQVELAEKYATRIWGLAGGRLVIDIPARRLMQRERQLIFG
jgi:phosphonate transport system ATP-binding protein